jgi:GMP synthase-like glutamine amidotransferase
MAEREAPAVCVWRFDGVTRTDGSGWEAAIVERLRAAGHPIRVADLAAGDDPHAGGERLHVLTGGSTATTDGGYMTAAIAHARRLVERARDAEVRAVGMCLGSQVLACARADDPTVVGPGPAGLEVGIVDVVTPVGLTAVATFHSHEIHPRFLDEPTVQLVTVPELFAHNEHSRVQGWLATGVLGLQFHPELSAEQLAEAVCVNADWVCAAGLQPEAVAAEIREWPIDADALFSFFVLDHLLGRRAPQGAPPVPHALHEDYLGAAEHQDHSGAHAHPGDADGYGAPQRVPRAG